MPRRPRSIRINKGIRIFRRSDSQIWQIEIRRPGRGRIRYSLDTVDEDEAVAVAHKRVQEIHEGTTGVVKPRDATLEEMLETYRRHAEARNEPGTRKLNYDNLARFTTWVQDHLGLRSLHGTDFTPDLIERYLLSRKKEGLHVDTINRERGTLSSFLERCRKKGLVRTNPVRQVDPLPTSKKRLPKTLEPDAIARLLEAASSPVELHGRGGVGQGNTRPRVTPLHDILFFVLNTGARQGEAIHLEWKDVDFRSGHVRLVNKKEHRIKHGDERAVRMNSALRSLLQRRKVRAGRIPWVFASAEGDLINRKNLSREMRGAIRRAKLEKADFNILRHTALTLAARSCKSGFVLKELAGHASIRTTERYYLGGMHSQDWTPPEVGT